VRVAFETRISLPAIPRRSFFIWADGIDRAPGRRALGVLIAHRAAYSNLGCRYHLDVDAGLAKRRKSCGFLNLMID